MAQAITLSIRGSSLEAQQCRAEVINPGGYKDLLLPLDMVLPGDRAAMEVQLRRGKYRQAKTLWRQSPTKGTRPGPFCDHWRECGGCPWQGLAYHEQLEIKKARFAAQLETQGLSEFTKQLSITSAPSSRGFRNRLDFTFSRRQWIPAGTDSEVLFESEIGALGFFVPRGRQKVVHIDRCHLMEEPLNLIRNKVFQWAAQAARDKGWLFYDSRVHEGWFRGLIVRRAHNGSQSQWMVTLVVKSQPGEEQLRWLEDLSQALEPVQSFFYGVNETKNDGLETVQPQILKGTAEIVQKIDHRSFALGPLSFFQTNPEQTRTLYANVAQALDLPRGQALWDLYCGTGTIGQYVATGDQRIVGIELNPMACENAQANALRNGLTKTRYLAGDMAKLLPQLAAEEGGVGYAVIDPPRAGLHPTVVKTLNQVAVKRLVYVSCNPETLARDLAMLKERYHIRSVEAVDMTPHSYHLEAIAVLDAHEL